MIHWNRLDVAQRRFFFFSEEDLKHSFTVALRRMTSTPTEPRRWCAHVRFEGLRLYGLGFEVKTRFSCSFYQVMMKDDFNLYSLWVGAPSAHERGGVGLHLVQYWCTKWCWDKRQNKLCFFLFHNSDVVASSLKASNKCTINTFKRLVRAAIFIYDRSAAEKSAVITPESTSLSSS